MSGRPYARNPNGTLGGATDLEAVLPHRFRLEIPRPSALSARDQAVCRYARLELLGSRTRLNAGRLLSRIIRERCREKNWKKLLIRRQRTEESESVESQNQPVATEAQPEEPAEPTPEKTEDPTESAKLRILELETALKQLAEQKHAKFLQLKEMLVEEARSRSSVPSATAPSSGAPASTDAAAPATTKKRRVEFAVSSPRGAAASSPRSASVPNGQDTLVCEAPAPADSSTGGVGP